MCHVKPDPLPFRRVLSVTLFAMMLTACQAWRGEGHAVLSDMVAGPETTGHENNCWLTIEFKDYPQDRDLSDVKVVFSSTILPEDVVYDWAFIKRISRHPPVITRGLESPPPVPAQAPPPLRTPMTAKYPLPLPSEVGLRKGRKALLTADLYWGGVKQDHARRLIEY